jgi:P22 coat protein - gene protein 5
MANVFTKAPRFVRTALGLLERDTVIARRVWRDAGGDFRGAEGDTINVKLPAFGVARKRAIRGGGNRQASYLAERTVPIMLTDNIYMRTPLTDAELTLDIESFERQIIAPQAGAIVRAIEDDIVDEIEAADYHANYSITYDPADPVEAVFEAAELLTKARVPSSMRFLAVGSTAKRRLLTSDLLLHADKAGDNSALRRAEIGDLAGIGPAFEVPALHPDAMVLYHQSAFALGLRAPVVPPDVKGSVDTYEGFAIRIAGITDSTEVIHNAHADVYIGTNHVKDAGSFDADGRFVPSEVPDPDGEDLHFVRAVELTVGS